MRHSYAFDNVVEESNNESDRKTTAQKHFTWLSLLLIWFVFLSLVAILIYKCKRWCDSYKYEKKATNLELIAYNTGGATKRTLVP